MKKNRTLNQANRHHAFLLTVGLASLVVWLGATALAESVIVTSETTAGVNTCPPFCPGVGNWQHSSLKTTAPGVPSRNGSYWCTLQMDSTCTITPTLGTNQGAYWVETSHGSASSLAPNFVATISSVGGSGLPATTEAFRRTNGVNAWYRIGTLTLDGTTYSPSITFGYASGDTNVATATRWYADAFRFVNTNTICFTTPELTTVNGPLAAGQTFVNVPNVHSSATNISVYSYDGSTYTLLGTKTSGIVSGVNAVTTTPLVKGTMIVASQTIGGIESCLLPTGPTVGGGANPRVRVSLTIRDSNPANHTIGANGGTAGTHLVAIKANGTAGGSFGVALTGGQVLDPSTSWQTVMFNKPTDSLFGWAGGYGDSWLTNQYGVLDSLAFCIEDTTDTGPYAIYLDNLVNGTNVIQDFEGGTNGQPTLMITQPGFSGSTTPYLLAPAPGTITPNLSVVVETNAATGIRSLLLNWQFVDDTAQAWMRASFQATNLPAATPNPIVDLNQPIYFDMLVLPVGQTAGTRFNGAVSYLPSLSRWTTESFDLAVNVTGSGTYTYQWQLAGNDLPGETKNSYSASNVNAAQSGLYTVVVRDGTSTLLRGANVTISDPVPGITNLSASTNVYVGTTVTFQVGATGHLPIGYPLTYQWQYNSTPIPDKTTATLTIANAQLSDTGTYDVVVGNPYGTTTSAGILLTVMPPVPIITNQPLSKLVAASIPAQFNVGASAPAPSGYPLRYQWQFGDVDMPDETNATLTIASAQGLNAGYYTAIVANDFGSSTSVVATLNLTAGIIGSGTGLKGSYYNDATYTNSTPPALFATAPVLIRVDPEIRFDWVLGSPDPVVTSDYFSTRWMGQVEAPVADTYSFYTRTDDGVKLYVDGQLLINQWQLQGPTLYTNTIALSAGKHDLVYEYYEKTGGAVAELNWFSTGLLPGPVPASQLYPFISSPTLGVKQDGSKLVFSWNYPYKLQSATNVVGAWLTVPGATSPYTNVIGAEPQKFFRLVFP